MEVATRSMEWINSPFSVVLEHFKNNRLDDVADYYRQKISQDDLLHQIPLVNTVPLDHVPSGSLVRYRGMIQDQFDLEFYPKVFAIVNRETGDKMLQCGMYTDILDIPDEYELDYSSPDSVSASCQTLYVVPIPGETDWTQQACKSRCGQSTGHNPSVITSPGKRKLEDVGADDEEEEEMAVDSTEGCHVGKRSKLNEVAPGNDSASLSPLSLNHPLPNETRKPCFMKVYDESTDVPVTGLFEFIGIISSDPHLNKFESLGSDTQDDLLQNSFTPVEELKAHNPPPSLVPRIHCILATPINHINPYIEASLSPPIARQELAVAGCDAGTCRENLMDILTSALLGDKLAAEYTLLHLLSRVYGRNQLMALGKFSLNLSHAGASLAIDFYHLLQQLLTKCHYLPLSLSSLNKSRFIPTKDYTANRLVAGQLQLSQGTHLVVDETKLEPGQLGVEGVANLKAIGNMIQWQRLEYDFKYHRQEFECDLQVLVFSVKRSIVKTDCHVPIQPHLPSPVSCQSLLSDIPHNTLVQLRNYFTLCRRLQYGLDPDVQKELEEDFVRLRKSDDTITGDTFHYLLLLARLLALSHGEDKLSLERWDYTKRLHQCCLARTK